MKNMKQKQIFPRVTQEDHSFTIMANSQLKLE